MSEAAGTRGGLSAPFARCQGVASPGSPKPLSSAVCRWPGLSGDSPSRGCQGLGRAGSSLTPLPSLQRAGLGGGGAGAAVQHQWLTERGQGLRAFPGPRAVRREPGWRAGRTAPRSSLPGVGERVPGPVSPQHCRRLPRGARSMCCVPEPSCLLVAPGHRSFPWDSPKVFPAGVIPTSVGHQGLSLGLGFISPHAGFGLYFLPCAPLSLSGDWVRGWG